MSDNVYFKAAKSKLRFSSGQGELSVEDLFDLSLTNLDNIAQKVNTQLKNEETQSFLSTKTRKTNSNNDLRLEILKDVIAVKEAEAEARKTRADNQARLARLKELMANKADEAFAAQSLEDIQKQIAELEAASF